MTTEGGVTKETKRRDGGRLEGTGRKMGLRYFVEDLDIGGLGRLSNDSLR